MIVARRLKQTDESESHYAAADAQHHTGKRRKDDLCGCGNKTELPEAISIFM